jgi:internalin A
MVTLLRLASIAVLILITALSATALGAIVHAGDKGDVAAIQTIQLFQGEIKRNEAVPGKPIISVNFYDKALTNEDLKTVTALTGLRSLSLGRTRVTDRGIEYLLALPDLQKLELVGTELTDVGLKTLARRKEWLIYLDLNGTKITDEGIRQLSGRG